MALNSRKRTLLLLSFSVAIALLLLGITGDSASPTQSAPDTPSTEGRVVPGSYIVLLKPGVNAKEAVHRLGLRAATHYEAALNGFTAVMSPDRAGEVSTDPAVTSIEPARLVGIGLHENAFQTLVEGVDRIDADANPNVGIGGIPGPNVNATIAVIDTGIALNHADLHVVGGYGSFQERLDESGSSPDYGPCGSGFTFDDEHGHGTHVAGTAAAIDNNIGVSGVAPGAKLYAVRILRDDGFGCDADVIKGIDWITSRKMEYNDGAGDGDPGINFTVANMSLGGLPAASICTAIKNSVDHGVMYAVAAGNNSSNATKSGPANCSKAVTVSAYADYDGLAGGLSDQICSWTESPQIDPDDSFAWFSNFGPAVEIAAPGVCVMSTYPGDDPGLYAVMSGTSMATPHVAGAMALMQAVEGFSGPYDGQSVMDELAGMGWTRPSNSVCGFSDDPDNSPEPILYLGQSCTTASFTPAPTPSPTPQPTLTYSPEDDPADIDCDLLVTGLDSILLFRFAANLATTLASDCPPMGAVDVGSANLKGDLNCDGTINHLDALIVLRRVGSVPGPGIEPCAS